jgi:hypothetical protein
MNINHTNTQNQRIILPRFLIFINLLRLQMHCIVVNKFNCILFKRALKNTSNSADFNQTHILYYDQILTMRDF